MKTANRTGFIEGHNTLPKSKNRHGLQDATDSTDQTELPKGASIYVLLDTYPAEISSYYQTFEIPPAVIHL